MHSIESAVTHFLHPGNLFARPGSHVVSTVLGSCVSVCLWDPVVRVGGMNHYMLPLWNGEGLPSPKYGNIAIARLIERLLEYGATRDRLQAKVFGGATVLDVVNSIMNIGARNCQLAEDILGQEKIRIVASDLGGSQGRKVIFRTDTGEAFMRRIVSHLLNKTRPGK